MNEIDRRIAGLAPSRPLTADESRELMGRNIDRLCREETERLRDAAHVLLGTLDGVWLWLSNEVRRDLGDPREALRAALAERPREEA